MLSDLAVVCPQPLLVQIPLLEMPLLEMHLLKTLEALS
jgi:hypothetical protein